MLKELNSSIRIIIVSSLILALILPSATSAELIFPTDTKEFVIDEADVLTQTEVDTLTEDLLGLFNDWETEIVVVIIESTAHYQIPDQLSDNSSNENSNNSTNGTSDNSTNGTSNNTSNETSNNTSNESMMELQDFSEALFDEWRVGDQKWKDGILLVLSINQSEDDYKWWFVTGIFWDEYWVFDGVGATSDSNIDAEDWSTALSIITDDLVTAVDDFWYENDGYVDPPANQQANDEANIEISGVDSLIGTAICLGVLVVAVVIIVLISRAGGGGGGFTSRFRNTGYNQGGYGYNQGFGHNEQHVYHHHDNHQSNNQPAPSKSRKSSSGGCSRGGSSRGSSSRGGGSSGGSSRGSSGGSSRSGGRSGGRKRR
jgi:hypothetical protein